MKEEGNLRLDTLAIHGGQKSDPATGARMAPIYMTTAYSFNDTDHAARLFDLSEEGNIYTRMMNPTSDVVEKRISLLEGGVGALSFSSGHAAIVGSILNIARCGDEIVSSSALYGGSYNMFSHTLPKLGITVRMADPADPENFRRAITPQTKAIFAEFIGNPQLDVLDLEKVAAVAHEAGLPLIIDNTFATPYLNRPLDFGADIVIHSATKFLGGHGAAMGGLVVDGGRFDWTGGRFPLLSEPDPSYHDLRYTELGKAAFITRLRVQIMRDLGACQSPFNSFLMLLGMETLHLRMKAHSENALAVAQYLAGHPCVSWVNYAALPGNKNYRLAQKYLPKGVGGMLTFGIKGGRAAGKKFIDSLQLFSLVANVGDTRSLVIHPASTTHSQLTAAQLASAGVREDMVRLSVGLEDKADLIDDLGRALAESRG